MSKSFIFILTGILGLFLSLPARAEAPPEERKRIESLISHVQSLNDAAFIRNGKEHDPATAAEFLRRKWRANARSVNSAKDFVDIVASGSSTTGKPYTIRLPGGKTVPCGEYLTAHLRKQR